MRPAKKPDSAAASTLVRAHDAARVGAPEAIPVVPGYEIEAELGRGAGALPERGRGRRALPAPEHRPDLRGDALTGRPPFEAATTLDTIMQVVTKEPLSPRALEPSIPRDIETVCLKCRVLRDEPISVPAAGWSCVAVLPE